MKAGTVVKRVRGRPTTDGAGVELIRIFADDLERDLDPFLMLDLFGSDRPEAYIAGFPAHPHRGFETITYLLAGRMRHQDSTGGSGVLESGGMQWMTAGRGVVHSEMPEQVSGQLRGFQLWLNLAAADKLCAPSYQDVADEALPKASGAGWSAVVLAGAFAGVEGAIQRAKTAPQIAVIELEAGATLELDLEAGFQAALLQESGVVQVAEVGLTGVECAVLSRSSEPQRWSLTASKASRVLWFAGRPLDEPIARGGPFVMNTPDEIDLAFSDYRSGRLA